MKEFVRDAFAHLGAEVADAGRALTVRLPAAPEGTADELATALGGSELRLVFDAAELDAESDLVAPGSHVLRVLEDVLARRGRRSYVVRPGAVRLTLAAVKAHGLRPAPGLAFGLGDKRLEVGYDVYVVYRLRFRSLERTDALETVRVALRPGAAPEVALEEPPVDVAEWDARPRKRAPAALMEEALALADERAARRGRAEAGRLADENRKAATKDLSRLHAYYAAQVAEWERSSRRELAMLRIEELEEERELRLRELAAATRVHAEVRPLQLLVVEVPLQRGRLRLKDRAQGADPRVEVLVHLDRATGALDVPPCGACRGDLARGRVAACASGHAVHQACIDACGRCARSRCAACGEVACRACGAELCPSCQGVCPACETTTCPEHLAGCARCGAGGCAACLQACAHCGEAVCSACRRPAGEGAAAVFCSACAVSCPGCRTATSAHDTSRCGRCGRRFCRACLPREAGACALCLEA